MTAATGLKNVEIVSIYVGCKSDWYLAFATWGQGVDRHKINWFWAAFLNIYIT